MYTYNIYFFKCKFSAEILETFCRFLPQKIGIVMLFW